MEPMKAAVIGACGANARNHLRAYENLGIDIRAIVDVNDAGKVLADEYGAEYFEDYRKLNKDIVDMASVSLPPYLHAPTVTHLVEKGIHVLCEKPLPVSVRDGKVLSKILSKGEVKVLVGFCFRFDKRFQKLKEFINSGSFGKLLYVNARYSAKGALNDGWRSKPEKGGGICFVNSIHYLDLVPWLTGQDVKSLEGFGSSAFLGGNAEDNIQIVLEHERGCITTISGHYWQFESSVVSFEIIGTLMRGRIEKELLIIETSDGKSEIIRFDENDMYFEEVNQFIQSIKNNKPVSCGIQEGIRAAVLAEETLKSIKIKGKVWGQN